MTAARVSPVRYQHLVSELGALLAELRYLGASYEACRRANALVDTVEPDTVGAIIHDLQSQIEDLRFAAEQDGVETRTMNRFDRIEFEEWIS